jgi:hypothetical protein
MELKVGDRVIGDPSRPNGRLGWGSSKRWCVGPLAPLPHQSG